MRSPGQLIATRFRSKKCKSILDGLNGIAYQDDSQVVELLVRKHRVKAAAEERAEIEIREEVGDGLSFQDKLQEGLIIKLLIKKLMEKSIEYFRKGVITNE